MQTRPTTKPGQPLNDRFTSRADNRAGVRDLASRLEVEGRLSQRDETALILGQMLLFDAFEVEERHDRRASHARGLVSCEPVAG